MPRDRRPSSKADLVKKWITGKESIFIFDANHLESVFCKVCEKRITIMRQHHVGQHIATQMHQKKLSEGSAQKIQQFIQLGQSQDQEFKEDLTEVILKGNIPWNILQKEVFKKFIRKYAGKTTPDESTLRKSYLPKLYEKVSSRFIELGYLK